MTEREQFEAWARTCDGNCNDRDLGRRPDGDYHNMLVQRDWDVWQASRRSALEEAANHITRGVDGVKQNGWIDAANERLRCADAIRALSQQDPQ